MAGDWIKWAKGLQDKPEVFRMSIELSLDRYSVAGRLMVVWAWADDNVPSSSVAENGDASVALGAQQKQLIDAVAGVPGFADSMSAAGWLSQRSGSLVFPNFARHNGETAKTRVLAAERMKKSRTERNKCCAATATKAQPEKRREEKISIQDNTPLPPEGEPTASKRKPTFDPLDIEFPPEMQAEGFPEAWARWVEYRKPASLKPVSWKAQAAKFTEHGPIAGVIAIDQSISNGWTGVFPEKCAVARQLGFRSSELTFAGLKEFVEAHENDG